MFFRNSIFGFLLGFCVVSGSALAEDDIWADYAPAQNWTENIDYHFAGRAVIASAGGRNAQITGLVEADANAQWISQSGLQIGVTGKIQTQRNHNKRDYGSLSADLTNTNPMLEASLVLGGSAPERVDAPKLSLEIARVDVSGALGDLRVGIDTGVAHNFHYGPKQAFSAAKSDNAHLHPDGIALARTRNSLSANLPKISYETPRWLGAKLGGSVSAPVKVQSQNFALTQLLDAETIDINAPLVEAGIDYKSNLKTKHLKLLAAASYGQTKVQKGASAQIETSHTARSFSASSRLEGASWSVGVAHRWADSALGQGQYKALSLGANYAINDDDITLFGQYTRVEDDSLKIAFESAELAGKLKLSPNFHASIGVRNLEPTAKAPSTYFENQQSIVLELSRFF